MRMTDVTSGFPICRQGGRRGSSTMCPWSRPMRIPSRWSVFGSCRPGLVLGAVLALGSAACGNGRAMSLAPEVPEPDPGVTTAAEPETCESVLRKAANTGGAPLMVRPSMHDFGIVTANALSAQADLTVTNCGKAPSGPVTV